MKVRYVYGILIIDWGRYTVQFDSIPPFWEFEFYRSEARITEIVWRLTIGPFELTKVVGELKCA